MTYTTYSEYLQTPQFRWVCGVVRERSRGICEDCGARKATEPHHVKYCRWGEFDGPDNLVDLCHECHCERHRCSRCGQVRLKARHIKSGSSVCDGCQCVEAN